MSRTRPSVGDHGTRIYIELLDENGDPLDPRDATALAATVIKPDLTEFEITLVVSTDLEDHPPARFAQFTIPNETPAWLDQAGRWAVRPRYTIGGVGSWRAAKPASFSVAA